MKLKEIITINPATELECGRYPIMDLETIINAINQARLAQLSWKIQPLGHRLKILKQFAGVLNTNQHKIAQLITTEMGKPIRYALGEVEKSIKLCDYYFNNAEKFLASEHIATEFQQSYRYFEPMGLIFAIMPWNYPLWQVMRFAIPNLVAGNGCVLKHAPNCSGMSLLIQELTNLAGFPENLFTSVIIDTDLCSDIIHNKQIAGVTFTGSCRTGKIVAGLAGSALKKSVVELGGTDAYLILHDANLKLAVEQSVMSRLNNSGQVCIAAKRLIVVDAVYDEFQKLLLAEVQKYSLGDPTLDTTLMGPMARKDLRDTLIDQVNRACYAGAKILYGGVMPAMPGFYYPPTILIDVDSNNPAFREELFGPVMTLIRARDEEHAIELANDSDYGLSGAVFTEDRVRGKQIAEQKLQVGTCAVNSRVASDPRLPFGGTKQSGYGRELSLEGMREFVNIKTIVIS
jgi:succinate-semialdehyde dehydrogenase/glutarate-semialdehyde dehydrogenase